MQVLVGGGQEVGMPGLETVDEHCEYVLELSASLIGCGRLKFCLKNKHFDPLAFFSLYDGS